MHDREKPRPQRGRGRNGAGLDTISASKRITLRPYQLDALDAVDDALDRGIRRQAIALPTGTGKTIIFAELVRRRGRRALVLVHRDELVRQAVEKFKMVAPELRVGIVKAERDELDADVVIASVQTVARPNRLARLGTDFNTIIIDEAHHAAASSYVRVMGHFPDAPLLLGVSATMERGDGVALGEVFEEVVFERDMLTMIADGYLADLKGIQVRLAADFTNLHTRHGDFIEAEAEKLLLDANAPAAAAKAYRHHADGRKALVFTPTVKTAHAMATAFNSAGISTEALDGNTPIDERRSILSRLKTGETNVVANCAVLTEGFDEPSVDCIIMARPTKSKPCFVQMIGRGTRIFPGKEDCLVLDLVGITNRHDLVTTATLFGIEPEAATKSVARAVEEMHEEEEREERRGRLVAQRVDLFRQHRFAWTHDAASGRFVLPTGNGIIAIVEEADGYVVRLATIDRKAVLARGVDVGYAQGVAEDYIRARGTERLVNPAAAWRQRPASAKQLAALKRMRQRRNQGMTAGEASNMIAAAVADRSFRRPVTR